MKRKSRNKKVLLGSLAVFVFLLWGICYIRTNRSVSNVPTKTYAMGEWVPMEGDRLNGGGDMSDYEVRVETAELMGLAQYEEKYQINFTDEQRKEADLPEMIYDLKIRVRNTGKELREDTGMDFWGIPLQGKELYVDTNDALYDKMNPQAQGSMQFALRPGSEMEFHLPFNIRREFFKSSTWKHIEKYGFSLVLTTYPQKKRVVVREADS